MLNHNISARIDPTAKKQTPPAHNHRVYCVCIYAHPCNSQCSLQNVHEADPVYREFQRQSDNHLHINYKFHMHRNAAVLRSSDYLFHTHCR